MTHLRFLVALALLFSAAGTVSSYAADNTPVDYGRDVRPILSDKCYKCHGPDEESRDSDLRLDREEDAEYTLSREDPGESELLHRITTDDPDQRMPPPDAKMSLSRQEIDTLRRWIEQKSPFEQHWSFTPIAPAELPQVSDEKWTRNEIDRFILARLDREQLKPADEAGREKLIRRLSFDLTGLAPTLEEIDAFVADQSDDAYRSLVDRLLAKPQYGERMAVDWLDTARYSDTYGYQVDRDRYVWPWRDWVIRAFNENLAYDQFILWQLAGDLLPDATDQQILATTFNRLHPQKAEGGSVPEEFRVEYVADRNHTFAMAFLGLTLECARCHDHKYDPITQKEYYQLFAFFNSIDEAGLYSFFTKSVPTPTMLLAGEKQQANLADLDQAVADAQHRLGEVAAQREEAFTQWLQQRPTQATVPGRSAHLDFEKPHANSRHVPGRIGKAVQLTGDDGIGLKVGNFPRYQPFSVSLWMNTPDVKERAVVFHRSRAWTDAGSRGYQLLIEQGKLSWSLIHFWPGNALRIRTVDPIPTQQWLHVTVTNDGSSRAAGIKIYVNGKQAACEVVRDNLYKNITGGGGDNITIGQRMRDRGFTNGLVDEVQVYQRQLTALEIAQLYDGQSLTQTLAVPVSQLSAQQKTGLRQYYLAALDPEYAKQLAALQAARQQRCKTGDGIQEIMVMRELPEPRPTYLLRRGAYDAPGDAVQPDTPAAMPSLAGDQPRNRLGLARWLVSPQHPLTARVAVNRFWQMCFGRGLVRTPEDFGSQGSPPTHPRLLDWLAHDFVQHQWDVKYLVKKIVMSATYRQSSAATVEIRQRDPENRLLARGPRYRWPAEMLRDNALAVSGLLVDKQGGPPARPYEVAESFKPVKADTGAGLYRRSLYTFWKRTAPAPVMMALDASKRDICTVQRERTSSPLQIFVLLNDPQLVEAARMLAQTMLQKHGDDVGALIDETFRRLTSRRPLEAEQQILQQLFAEQLKYFQTHPQKAEEYLKVGRAKRDTSIAAPRLAAAGVLVGTLMNYDECVIKR